VKKLLVVLGLVLAGAGAAHAGGWATVGLSSLPDGVGPGQTWQAELTVLQHGRTPLTGIEPTLTIRNADSGTRRTFAGRPTGRPGVYVVAVRFPSAGRWTIEAYDGFVQYGGARTHTFGGVEVVPGGGGGSGFRVWPVAGGILAALGIGALALALRRRLRAQPAATSHA
jgi:hypothetical protein